MAGMARKADMASEACARVGRMRPRVCDRHLLEAGGRPRSGGTSSAGTEASLWGVPVIELIPAGSLDLLPSSQWGTLGTARTEQVTLTRARPQAVFEITVPAGAERLTADVAAISASSA